MREIKIELTEDERAILEYNMFAYQGIQINFNQIFLSNFKFNNEHYDRIIDTLAQRYSTLQKQICDLLYSRGHEGIRAKSYDFFINDGMLFVRT